VGAAGGGSGPSTDHPPLTWGENEELLILAHIGTLVPAPKLPVVVDIDSQGRGLLSGDSGALAVSFESGSKA
jgi:hypothetical protein